MAEQEQVGGIGLGLFLDTTGFSAGMARAKSEIAGLGAKPVEIRAVVAVQREAIKVPVTPVMGISRQDLAGFRAQIQEGLKATGGSVQVGVRLGRINFAALRSEIAAGIGVVPIKVSIAGGGKASALNLVAATVAEQSGGSSQNATSFVKNAAAKRGIPTRQYGGPVGPRRTVMVGENGPELAEFGGPVQIHSSYSAPTRAWRGARARAYAATMANEGGTFDPRGSQPSRGYALATQSGTAFRMAADDRLAFIRAFRDVAKRGSPYVGTWLHDGEIDVDPATVVRRKREADKLARSLAQEAYFNLGTFDTIATRRRRGDPSTGQMGFGFAGGGYVRQGKRGVGHFSERAGDEDRDFLANLRDAHSRIQPHHLTGGEAWYRDNGAWGRAQARQYGVDENTGIGVLAALSAGTEWKSNKTKYQTVLAAHQAGRPFPYDVNLNAHRTAKAILEGQNPEEALAASPKVGQFYHGLMGDLSTLTLDRWAFRTATRGKLDISSKGPIRTKIEHAWRQVAKEFGMAPAVSQAALWLLEKEEHVRGGAGGERQGLLGLASGGFAHASETSALNRLREITSEDGTIQPGFSEEAQSINLLVERMRSEQSRVSPWVERMRARQGRPKEFGRARGGRVVYKDGFATMSDPAAERRSYRLWLRQANQPRDPIGRYMSPYDQGAYYDRAGYNSPDFMSLVGREPFPQRMRSEDEGTWLRARGGRVDADAFERDMLRERRRPVEGTIIAKLKAMAAQTTQSPNEAAIAQAKLDGLRNRGRRAGGPVSRRYVVRDPDGVHGRPAQVLAGLLHGLDARISAENASIGDGAYGFSGGGQRIFDWLSLNARGGHRVRVTAEGPDAARAQQRIKGILGFNPYGSRSNAAERASGFADFDPSIGAAYRRQFQQLTKLAVGGEAWVAPWVRRMREQGRPAVDSTGAYGGVGGQYIVGERGPELFVPRRMEGVIPPDVMQRLPKREQGGIVEIGQKPFSLWSAPEDGWIIPNHLRNRIPHAATGRRVGAPGQQSFDFTQIPLNGPGWAGLQARVTEVLPVKIAAVDKKAAVMLAAPPIHYAVPKGEESQPRHPATFHDPTNDGALFPKSRWLRELAERREIAAARRGVAEDDALGNTGFGYKTHSQTHPLSDELRMLPGVASLTAGRSSVRSAAANIGSFFLGNRQSDERARMEATRARQDLSTIETHDAMFRQQKLKSEEHRQTIRDRMDNLPEGSKARAALTKRLVLAERALERDTIRVDEHAEVVKKANDAATAAEKRAQPGGKNIAQNIFGIALGTTGYQLMSQAISAAFSAAMPALEKWVDQMSGFGAASTKATSALAEDTLARHGNATAAIAGAAATAGLSAASMDFISAIVKPTVMAKAGAKAQGETSDLFRAAAGTGFGAPQGLYGGYGGIAGGPLFAGPMGGGAGFTEQIAGDISAFRGIANNNRGGGIGVLNNPLGDIARMIPGVGDLLNQADLLAPPGPQGPTQQRATQAIESYRTDVNAANDRGRRFLADTNTNLELITNATGEQAKQFALTGKLAGDEANAARMAASGAVLVDKVTHQVVSKIEDYQKFWEQAATGKTVADPATVMRQLARSVTATFAGIEARTNRALTVSLPTETAFGLISNPLVAGANILPTGGIGAAGVTGAARGTIGASLGLSGRAQADIRSEAALGLTAARNDIATNDASRLPMFNQEMAKAQAYSVQIEATTNRITLEQANLSAHEFAQTMFYLNRQLSDAKGLAGEISGPNNLGSLQRSAFMLGRQQTAIGLDLQQRQITTQVALAGFQAPGESPEERYARREEAMIRARTQQRQLGLSRQQFGVEGQIFNVQAQRGVSDTLRSIGLTQEQRNVSLDTAAANKAIDDAGKALGIHLKKAGLIVDEAGQKVETKLGVAVDFMAQYGGTMQAATAALDVAMKNLTDPKSGLAADINSLLSSLVGPATPTGGTSTGGASGAGTGGGVGGAGGGFASGVVGMAMGPTHMYVGEAGRETVAILRNPRVAQMGWSGGGGQNITIMVTGNTFSGPGDDQKLVQRIEVAVLSAMARRGQLLGLRGPSN